MAEEADPLVGAHLAAFVAAVDAASVRGAADALGLTASAVTKRVQALEQRTGTQLFERGRFGLRTTAAGQALYPEALTALAALRQAEATLAAHHRAGADVPLALAASHTIGEFLLPGWIAGFRAESPGARVRVDVINSPAVLAAVRDRTADIGFVEGVDDTDGLEAITVHRDEILVVVAAGHPWARRRRLRARELRGQPYFTREAGSGTRAVATAALLRAGIELEPALEAASTQSVKRAVATSGFSLLSGLAIAAEQQAGTLCGIPVSDLELHRELRAVRDPSRRLDSQTRGLWRWLAARGAVLLR